MTIKEIAELSDVSVSTVSKILNNKDENIRQETRERVLRIAKQYHYAPHNKTTFSDIPSRLLGVMLTDITSKSTLSQQLAITARENGYSLLLCPFSSEEEEKHCLELFQTHHVEGYLRECVPDRFITPSKDNTIPSVLFSMGSSEYTDYCIDYEKMGYLNAKSLLDLRHQQLLCLAESEDQNALLFLKGFKRCLFDYKIPFDATMFHIWDKHVDLPPFMVHQYTGAVCTTATLATRLSRHVQALNLRIPKDFSICCVKHHHSPNHATPKLQCINFPIEQLGQQICKLLIDTIERRPTTPFALDYEFTVGESLDIPRTLRSKKIIVIGAINMDILLNAKRIPESGETISVQKRLIMPGGKGLNQALGATRLGADVYLIGKIGKDYDGSTIYDFMNVNKVNTDGIVTSDELTTGNAYITVQENGESCISIFNGANNSLSEQDIQSFDDLFEHASYCLLQTEIHTGAIEYAIKKAKEHGAKTILKPCDVTVLDDHLLKQIDLLIPNEKEADRLLPHLSTVEEKASYFRNKGVDTVIITLSSKGCYLQDDTHSQYFDAAKFEPVDTTGAADAFIATLAVYLSKNYPIDVAIQYANYAAGYSTTRQGVPPSLIDQTILEFSLSDKIR